MVWGAKMILWVYILWHSIITIIQCLINYLWIRQQNPQNLAKSHEINTHT